MQVALATAVLIGGLGLSAGAVPGAPDDPTPVTKELVVKAVLETAPLQLTATAKVDGKVETFSVALTDDTEVLSDGKPAKPGAILPGQTIRVYGKLTGDKRFRATKIEIVKAKP